MKWFLNGTMTYRKLKNEGKLKIGLENDNQSIDFVPNTSEETTEFTLLLIKEIRLQGGSMLRKDIGQLQDKLQDCLQAEESMEKMIGQIIEENTCVQAMQHIIMFVMCIMHCKSRVGIKILTMLLIEGLSNYQGVKFLHLADVTN